MFQNALQQPSLSSIPFFFDLACIMFLVRTAYGRSLMAIYACTSARTFFRLTLHQLSQDCLPACQQVCSTQYFGLASLLASTLITSLIWTSRSRLLQSTTISSCDIRSRTPLHHASTFEDLGIAQLISPLM